MKPALKVFSLIACTLAITWNGHAQQYLKEAVTGTESYEAMADSQKANLILEYGQEAMTNGRMREARSYLMRLEQLADSLNYDYARQLALYGFGDLYLVQQKFDSAKTVLTQAATLDAPPSLQLKVNNLLATSYRYLGDNQSAVNLYQKALSQVDTVREAKTAAGIAQNMGDAYMNMGATAEAFRNYHKAISFGEQTNDSLFLATSLNNIGEAHNTLEEYDKAASYLERALEISRAINFQPGRLRVLLNLGNTRSSQLNFEEAESLYQKALKLSEQLRPDTPPIQIQYNLGELYNRMGKLEQAESYFRLSFNNSKESGVPQGIYYNATGLGNIAIGRNDSAGAAAWFGQALDIAEMLKNPGLIQQSHRKLYELKKGMDDYEAALRHLEQAKIITDSLSTLEKAQMLADYQTRLDVQQKVQENNVLKVEKAQQEGQITLRNWLLAIGLLALLIIGFITVLLVKVNREKERINRKLESRKKELEEANEVKNKLFGIVAHDLRTPLSALTGILELVRVEALSEGEIKELFSEMEFSLHQNMNIMENLLVWAKQQMSGLKIQPRALRAGEVVDEIVQSHKFNARHKKISLRNNISQNLVVKGDYDLIKLVIRNLISNSIKFSGDGDEIVVDATVNGSEVLFEVRDTGIGIPEEQQVKIFGEGLNSRTGTRQEKGSGLGLNLCKEFIEVMGGSISFESEDGVGTTFYLTLPLPSEAGKDIDQEGKTSPGEAGLKDIYA